MGSPSAETPPDTNYGPTYLIVIGVFTTFAVSLCSARIYSRIRPKVNIRFDDYLVATAMVLAIAIYTVSIVNYHHGWGHHSAYVSTKDVTVAMKCMFTMQILWILAIALVRISIASSLLRLSNHKAWRSALWIIITIQILIYFGLMVFQLFNCSSIRANWEPVYNLRCWDRKYILVFGKTANSIVALFDFILALMPIRLIMSLHRPTHEKVLICCLMAMGILAGAISVYTITLSKKTFSGDLLSTTVILSLWREMEVLIGLMAACLPPLKASAERGLRRLGLVSESVDMERPSFVTSRHNPEYPQHMSPVGSDSSPSLEKAENK